MDKDIANALKTWYPESDKLHTDLIHPTMKLAGESGELLDLVAKHLFKPNFDMWQCAKCGHPMDYHLTENGNDPQGNWRDAKYCIWGIEDEDICDCAEYVPKVLDEIGDITYYQRIIKYLIKHPDAKRGDFSEMVEHLAVMNLACAQMFFDLIWRNETDASRLQLSENYLKEVLDFLGVNYKDVIELNYKKLNSEETHHGWKSEK